MPMILANHDYFAGDRVFNQLNGNLQQYRLAAAMYLLLSSQPYTYYGEEIGMAAGLNMQPDASLRTPMSWDNDATHAGFSTRTPFRPLSANYATHNVTIHQANDDSLYHWYRQLYALRSAHPTIANGSMQVLSSANAPLLAVTRSDEAHTYLMVINVSAQTRSFSHSFSNASANVLLSSDEVAFATTMNLPAGFVGVWQLTAQ